MKKFLLAALALICLTFVTADAAQARHYHRYYSNNVCYVNHGYYGARSYHQNFIVRSHRHRYYNQEAYYGRSYWR